MYKYFTYQFETKKYTGYRLLTEKSMFDNFKKLTYTGFIIIYNSSDIIHFKMESQLIRKLKLKKLSDEINLNSIEDKLFQLLERSKEKNDDFIVDSFTMSYWYNYEDVKLVDNLREDVRERKKYLINQSKKNIQKIKQYENKSRFRK